MCDDKIRATRKYYSRRAAILKIATVGELNAPHRASHSTSSAPLTAATVRAPRRDLRSARTPLYSEHRARPPPFTRPAPRRYASLARAVLVATARPDPRAPAWPPRRAPQVNFDDFSVQDRFCPVSTRLGPLCVRPRVHDFGSSLESELESTRRSYAAILSRLREYLRQ